MQGNKTVEKFIVKKTEWKKALELLRSIILSTEMNESIKWGIPVYSIHEKNVLGIAAFKAYVGIWFYQGVFFRR